jgi:hypothetical protein
MPRLYLDKEYVRGGRSYGPGPADIADVHEAQQLERIMRNAGLDPYNPETAPAAPEAPAAPAPVTAAESVGTSAAAAVPVTFTNTGEKKGKKAEE